MREYKSPVGFEGPTLPLSAAVVRLLLALVAFVLTAAMWFGVGAQGTRTQAQRLGLGADGSAVAHVTLPPVLVVGHRDATDDPAMAVRATGVDCARRPSLHSGGRKSG